MGFCNLDVLAAQPEQSNAALTMADVSMYVAKAFRHNYWSEQLCNGKFDSGQYDFFCELVGAIDSNSSRSASIEQLNLMLNNVADKGPYALTGELVAFAGGETDSDIRWVTIAMTDDTIVLNIVYTHPYLESQRMSYPYVFKLSEVISNRDSTVYPLTASMVKYTDTDGVPSFIKEAMVSVRDAFRQGASIGQCSALIDQLVSGHSMACTCIDAISSDDLVLTFKHPSFGTSKSYAIYLGPCD